jgi:thiamine-monophosphate kinase
MDSEDKLVERIARSMSEFISSSKPIGRSSSILELGVGDDSAVVRPGAGHDWTLSSDAFLEGVHFLGDVHPADSVGYKALVRAASDLAAMGATPRFFLMTLAIPMIRTGAWLNRFLQGMKRAARMLDIRLVGGDTTKFPLVMASMTVIGEVARGTEIRRGGARPGDLIYVTGTLGAAELGLELVKQGHLRRKNLQKWIRPHLYPRTRIQLGAWLARKRLATSMMDLSDGLSTDLPRLCKASGVGARLRSKDIPQLDIAKIPRGPTRNQRFDALAMALHGGEDYELLFTVPARHLKKMQRAPGFRALRAIGIITADRSILLENSDGTLSRLRSRGWDPFRKGRRKRG